MSKEQLRDLEAGTFVRERLYEGRKSTVARYRDLVIGEGGWWHLLKYEVVTTLAGPVPGALGLVLRKLSYKRLFGAVGKGVIIGRSVTLRHPQKIHLGSRVVLDDYCVIDARGAGPEGIVIGDDVIVGRNAALLAKNGHIRIGDGTNIGSASFIVSRGGVEIGRSALLGGECHISGGMYHSEDLNEPVMHQGIYTRGPIVIGAGVWLGAKVSVLDGVRVGDGCLVGAGAVVTKALPERSVSAGTPARVMRSRGPAPAVGDPDGESGDAAHGG